MKIDKKILKSKKVWLGVVVVLLGVGLSAYQNCSGSGGSSQNSATSSSSECTLPTTLSWTVGSYTCSASTGGTSLASGESLTLSETSPYVGSATFTCNLNTLNSPTGTTCNPSGSSDPDSVCGSANGEAMTSAPESASQLCSAGSASVVSGSGPWTWTCTGADGSVASCSATYGTGTGGGTYSDLVQGCTMSGYSYPTASGFLLSTTAGSAYGTVCCELGIGATAGNGRTWYCQDSAVSAGYNGPATPLPAGSGCSFKAAGTSGYPVGGGVITYNQVGSEFCCSTDLAYNGSSSDGVTSYCESTTAKTLVNTVSTSGTPAGATCNISDQDYPAGYGVTFYTSTGQRVCCEIGLGYNGAGNGKGWYCEGY